MQTKAASKPVVAESEAVLAAEYKVLHCVQRLNMLPL